MTTSCSPRKAISLRGVNKDEKDPPDIDLTEWFKRKNRVNQTFRRYDVSEYLKPGLNTIVFQLFNSRLGGCHTRGSIVVNNEVLEGFPRYFPETRFPGVTRLLSDKIDVVIKDSVEKNQMTIRETSLKKPMRSVPDGFLHFSLYKSLIAVAIRSGRNDGVIRRGSAAAECDRSSGQTSSVSLWPTRGAPGCRSDAGTARRVRRYLCLSQIRSAWLGPRIGR